MTDVFSGLDEKTKVQMMFNLGRNSDNADESFSIGKILGDMGYHQQAFELFEKASKMGNIDAYTQLGLASIVGYDMNPNPKAAFSNFEAASNAGDKWATVMLAAFCHYGIGIAKPDDDKAKGLLKNLGTNIDVFCVAGSAEEKNK